MDIRSLCEREVAGIAAGASVQEAAAVMREQHVGALVVVTRSEPSGVVGILTDRDIALAVAGQPPGAVAALRAGDLAQSPAVAVRSSSTLQEAVAAMEQAGVRRLLVVDQDGGVVGLVAAEDLLAAIAEELAGLVRALRAGITREKHKGDAAPAQPAARPIARL